MLVIPIESPNHTEDMVIIVLDDASIGRMATSDPAEVILRECGRMLVNPSILVCHQNSTPELTRLLHGWDIAAIIKYLQRGFTFRPDKGDHDNSPSRLSGLN